MVKELPGCGSQSSTEDGLTENIADAIREYLLVQGASDENAEPSEENALAV